VFSDYQVFNTFAYTPHKYSHIHYAFLIHKQLINFGHASCGEILGGTSVPSHPGQKRPPHWRANIDVVLGVISEMTGTTKPLLNL